jgi:nucleoside recognition membrane protein YjiH
MSPLFYFIPTGCVAIVAGFLAFNRSVFFRTTAGQIVISLFTIPCFVFIGFAFWRFGWQAGLAETFVIFLGASFGQSILEYLTNRRE